ncbi:complex I NDUFA9 subunit family protein [Martelella mediterranea]|uniref:Hopanoid-associated sugar epimerase n=1 Tax=Martelella mediterranea DSM 17316 TaxID=1122214 RepID=A0A1U9YZF9_9HYPH|nr:complex I NDUFA9 subunit family protein [Martelella mediterranea]AQZ50827.1 hopanoid-associated sugar epimerase [Martelella mediterranea DSM 17316]
MTLSNIPPLVTVFGGSGFVGRYVVRALAKRGYRIRVAVRRPDLALFLQPLGNVGQITFMQANLRYEESVRRAIHGADHVVNCVGILFESGKNGFDAVQTEGARLVAEVTCSEGAKLTHVSAIGADADSPSHYARSKGVAEASIREICPDAVIVRPSIIFGPEDDFFNKFGKMSLISPILPLIGGGETKFQPVYVGDVAEVIARSVEGKLEGGKVYELGGRDVLTFRECLELLLSVTGRKRALLSMPFGLASLFGSIASLIPFIAPPLTSDQVKLLKADNVVSEEAQAEGRTLDGLGIRPAQLEVVLRTYLVQYRQHGQFGKIA